MRSIKEFFAKITNARAREALLRTAVQSALKDSVWLDVPLADISISSGIVGLKNVGQAAKSVVFIKKTTILARISANLPNQIVSDIRLNG